MGFTCEIMTPTEVTVYAERIRPADLPTRFLAMAMAT